MLNNNNGITNNTEPDVMETDKGNISIWLTLFTIMIYIISNKIIYIFNLKKKVK